MDIWETVTAERNDFADLLESLSPEQWDAPTLCAGWRVRDVAGHIAAVSTTAVPRLMATVALSGFRIDHSISQMAKAAGTAPPAAIVARIRGGATSRILPPGVKPQAIVGDVLAHGQDIRRPLGLKRDIPEDRLRIALDAFKNRGSVIRARGRTAGLRLVATDIDWSHGSGPEVSGPGEAILLTMIGRGAAAADLTGEGVATLAARC